jgi:hypothetical protein
MAYTYWMAVAQKYMQDTADKLPTPCLIDLTTDPQEQGAALTLGFRHLSRANVTVTNEISPASHVRAPIRALPRRSWYCWVAQK